eukprot:5974800-Lingulodinium_polyedra.AAC.1
MRCVLDVCIAMGFYSHRVCVGGVVYVATTPATTVTSQLVVQVSSTSGQPSGCPGWRIPTCGAQGPG